MTPRLAEIIARMVEAKLTAEDAARPARGTIRRQAGGRPRQAPGRATRARQ